MPYYGIKSLKIPSYKRLVHLRKKIVPAKILWFISPHGERPISNRLSSTPHINSLSGIPIHMPQFPPHLWLTASRK